SGTPATEPLAVEQDPGVAAGMRAALHHARLQTERDAIAAAIPPDPGPRLEAVDRELAELRRDRSDLHLGRGRYADTPEGDAARRLLHARQQHRQAQHHAETAAGWRERRHWHKEATRWADQESAAEAAFALTVEPETRRLDEATTDLYAQRGELGHARREHDA